MSQSDQVLRTGVLFKKGSGTGPFGRKNWKPRYFVLTPTKLKYYTFEDGDLRGVVDLTGCDEGMLEVMPMDSMKTGSSASTIWRIAVNAPERRLLVAAGTEMEMNDWVDKLLMAFRVNHGQPMLLPHRTSLSQAHAPSSASSHRSAGSNTNSNGHSAGITDFQNFSAPRRAHHGGSNTGRPSVGHGGAATESLHGAASTDERLSDHMRRQSLRQSETDASAANALALRQQSLELEELRREEREREDAYQREQMRRFEEAQREAAEAEAQAIAAKQLEREAIAAAEARRYHEEALRQQQIDEQAAAEAEARERERERERDEQERQLAMHLQQQSLEAKLDEQRRLKREQHARERLAREQSMRASEAQLAMAAATADGSDEYDVDAPSDSDSDSSADDDRPRLSAAAAYGYDEPATPAVAPRSSLIDDVKREASLKQQVAHQRRREAALRDEQQRLRDVALADKLAAAQQTASAFESQPQKQKPLAQQPRVVEVVRRGPTPKAAAGEQVPLRQSLPKVDSFEF